MNNNYNYLEEEYRDYFYPFNEEYYSADRQAESFKIVTILKNVDIAETQNTVMDN